MQPITAVLLGPLWSVSFLRNVMWDATSESLNVYPQKKLMVCVDDNTIHVLEKYSGSSARSAECVESAQQCYSKSRS